MGFTFLQAMGKSLGSSLVEESGVELAKRVMKIAAQRNVRIVLPQDVRVAEACVPGTSYTEVSIDQGIPQGLALFKRVLLFYFSKH